MCIMCAQEKEDDRDAQQEFLGGCILVSVLNLLPHVEVVICSGIELEWHSPDIMEHQIRAKHVADVGECPRNFLIDPWYDIE